MNPATKSLGSVRTSAADTDGGGIGQAIELGAPRPADAASDIPDGGVKAWLQVAGGFALFFNTWQVPDSK